MIKLAVFASGRGSNAVCIHQYGAENEAYETALIVTNRKKAGVLEYACEQGITCHVVNRTSFYESRDLLEVLQKYKVDAIALAGFLWLIPQYLIDAYPNKIVNIHPALLPKYGGKGMYGRHIHEAVASARERYSGITIHYVNEHYDEGAFIYQSKVWVHDLPPPAIAEKVLRLEHYFYPRILAGLSSQFKASG